MSCSAALTRLAAGGGGGGGGGAPPAGAAVASAALSTTCALVHAASTDDARSSLRAVAVSTPGGAPAPPPPPPGRAPATGTAVEGPNRSLELVAPAGGTRHHAAAQLLELLLIRLAPLPLRAAVARAGAGRADSRGERWGWECERRHMSKEELLTRGLAIARKLEVRCYVRVIWQWRPVSACVDC